MPLVLSLRRPDGRVVERLGIGLIVINDQASAADIAKGVLWGVGLRAAQEAQAAALKPQPPAPAVDAAALTGLAQAAHDKQVAAGHAATLGKLQATLPAAAFAQTSQRIGLRLQGQTLQQANAAVPVKLVSAGALGAPMKLAAPGAAPLQATRARLLATKGGTDSTQGAATGGVDLSTPPALAATSTGEGDPGTPVTLSGSDFGDAPGEVHFIVGNGRDVAAPIAYWSAAQIVTEVPYADGIPLYDGHVYVKRRDGLKTAPRAFRFLPLYDVTEIGMPANNGEWLLAPSIVNIDSDEGFHRRSAVHSAAMFWGFTGNDKFYPNSQLRNGWVVSGASLGDPFVGRPGHGGAYLVNARPGTTSPCVEVRWWLDAAVGIGGSNNLIYRIKVAVQRPKNLPCQANPCPVL